MHGEIRLVKIKESDFLVCAQSSLFGREKDFIKSWKENDCIVFIIDNSIAGVAKINGKMFVSTDFLWLNENPYRIPIQFIFAFPIGKRPSFDVHKKDFIREYGKNWGNVFVCRHNLPTSIQKSIWNNIELHKDDSNLGSILDKIKNKIHQEQQKEFEEFREEYREMKEKVSGKILTFEQKKEYLTDKMLRYVNRNIEQLEDFLNKDSFVSILSDDEYEYLSEVGYATIKDEVKRAIFEQGHCRPTEKVYGEGTYLIVGDSHGDFTKSGMFDLLHRLNDFLRVDKIFHIGHFVDNNGVINRHWDNFDNLVIISRLKERVKIEKYVKTRNPSTDVVKNWVWISDVMVANHELGDNANTKPGSLVIRKPPFIKSVILNHHSHSLDVARSDIDTRYVQAYPGCLCEKHDSSEKRDQKYTPGILERTLKDPMWSKQNAINEIKKEQWEQGLIILHVSSDGNYTLVPCSIKKIRIDDKVEFVLSYFDKIITESGIYKPDKKTFINADLHAPLYDGRILDIQDQIVKDYLPDVYVNLGDMRNSDAFNHHIEKKGIIVTERIIDEAGLVYALLKKMSKWIRPKGELHFIYGNHERFGRDWVKKHPAFAGWVEFEVMCACENLGYKLCQFQEKLELEDVVYIHGDVMKGTTCYLENLALAFPGQTVVCGHHHYTSIRRGCYSVGFSGQWDQKYNEIAVTKWNHGFALCNTFKGVSFISNLIIDQYQIILNGKVYSSEDSEFWRKEAVNYRIEKELLEETQN